MSTSIDVHAAGSANTFATVVVESDGLFAFGYKLLVKHVKHLEEGHFRRDVLYLVCLEAAFGLKVLLLPHFKCEIHIIMLHTTALSEEVEK
jgi:hypothetical protein